MEKKGKSRLLKYSLGVLQLFIGVTAVLGGWNLITDPTGASSQLSLEWLKNSPFVDYLVPGLVLVVVNGVGYLCAALLTFLRSKHAGITGTGFGAMLILYMIVEVWTVGLLNPLQPLYFLLGIIVLVMSLKLHKKETEENQLILHPEEQLLPT